jgi:hypothetical protein
MAIICKLINATTWWVLNKDSDIQALAHTIMNEWVIADADTSDFEVTAWQVWSWRALIEVTRTNTTPNEKFMLYVWNQQDEAKTLWSNKKIFIKIPQDNINDNTLNTNPTWSWIATIEVDDAYPASDYYLSIAETDWSWNITDTRTFTTIKWSLLDSVASTDIKGWNWKVFYTNWSGINTELALWDATKVLTSNGTTSAPTFESPTVDINSLSEKTSTIAADDMLIVYDPWVWNKKHLAQASETNEWLVERATDAEATTWTDTTRYITPKQVKDNYWQAWNINWTAVAFTDTSAHTWTITINLWASNVNTVYLQWYIYIAWFNSPTWDYKTLLFNWFFKLTDTSAIDFNYDLYKQIDGSGSWITPSALTLLSSGNYSKEFIHNKQTTTLITSTYWWSITWKITWVYRDWTNLKIDYELDAISWPDWQRSWVKIWAVTIIN